MNICVINGLEKKGITYTLKELMMQKGVIKQGIPSIYSEHWKENGWLDKQRPWKSVIV